MSPVVFRPVTSEDELAMLRMMRNLAEQEPGAYEFRERSARSALRGLLANPNLGQAWVFFDGQTSVGYMVLTLGYSFEYLGCDAFIDELYVEPQYRRLGIGRRAVQFAEERARELGVHALHLEVDHGNDAALRLYQQAGYEDHARYLLTKWLNPDERT